MRAAGAHATRRPWPAPAADRPAARRNRAPRVAVAADQHKIDTRDRLLAPARSRAASFSRRRVRLRTRRCRLLRHGESQPRRAVVVARQRLQHQAGHRRLAALRRGAQELRPALQAAGRALAPAQSPGSGGQALAALGAAVGQHLAAADGRHAGAEPVPPLADQLRRLIGALHGRFSDDALGARTRARAGAESRRPSQAAAYRGRVPGPSIAPPPTSARHNAAAAHCHATAREEALHPCAMRTRPPLLPLLLLLAAIAAAWAAVCAQQLSWAALARAPGDAGRLGRVPSQSLAPVALHRDLCRRGPRSRFPKPRCSR